MKFAPFKAPSLAEGVGLLEKAQKESLFPNENETNFIPTKPLEFSIEAKAVFNAGRELWCYYHAQDFKDPQKPYNANASLTT